MPNADDYDQVIIVVGNTQNSPSPATIFEDQNIEEIVAGVFYSSKPNQVPNIQIISASGDNYSIDSNRHKLKPAKNINSSNNNLKKLKKELAEDVAVPADGAGADYLAGIAKATEIIDPESKKPLILVLGSGYNDKGVLDFAHNDIFATYRKGEQYFINSIFKNERSMRQDMLSNIEVVWYNLGSVAPPQSNMDKFKNETRSIYECVLKYLGTNTLNLNYYAPITADVHSVDSAYTVGQVYVNELKVGDFLNVNENIGRFYPNENRLMDEKAVAQKMEGFAARFNPNSKTKLNITGYSAICADNGEMGKARAEAIQKILIKLGIPASKITTRGMRGSPPEKGSREDYTCNSSLPEMERRTVKVEVVSDE